MSVLNRPVLVLNARWQPICTTNVKQAIGLIARGTAKIVATDDYQVYDLISWNDISRIRVQMGGMINSAKLSLLPPEVIVLLNYDGINDREVIFSRRNLFKRDNYSCQYCNRKPGSSELTIDHIKPRSCGGKSTWENCVVACVECNAKKSDLSLEESGLKLRKLPKKPTWKLLTPIAQIRCESWEKFIDKAYWNIELQP